MTLPLHTTIRLFPNAKKDLPLTCHAGSGEVFSVLKSIRHSLYQGVKGSYIT